MRKNYFYNSPYSWVVNDKDNPRYVLVCNAEDPINLKGDSEPYRELANPKRYKITFGKYEGLSLDKIEEKQYLNFLIKNPSTDPILKSCIINQLDKLKAEVK